LLKLKDSKKKKRKENGRDWLKLKGRRLKRGSERDRY
jgi:hypothetical protein